MTLKISIPCDKMGVRHHARGVMVTDRLPAVATITLEDGSTLETPITFPETFVREKSLTHWVVDPCSTTGSRVIYLSLPAEDCDLVVMPRPVHILAAEIIAKGTVVLPDGSKWDAVTTFPAAPAYWHGPGHWQVDALVATGTAERIPC